MARPKKEKPNRADGLYEVKVTVGKTFDGKLIRKSFYSPISKEDAKRQAEEYKIEMEVSARTGDTFITKDITFGEWALKWLQTYKKGKVKEHTYNFTYRVNIENHLIPYFGNAELTNIRQVDIQGYFNKRTDLAKSTLEKHKMILKDIFEKAIYNDLCVKNPVVDIKLGSNKVAKRNVWNREQSELAYNYAKKYPEGIGIVVILATGVRRSELIGLEQSDFDFEKKNVHIQRAVVPTTGEIIVGDTKTVHSNRIIPVSDDFIDYILSLNTTKYIINNNGNIVSPNSYAQQFKRFMEQMCDELRLPILTPHELRHTYGTVLREKGVDIYTIQKLMGHADISITASIYVHNDIDVLRKNMKL